MPPVISFYLMILGGSGAWHAIYGLNLKKIVVSDWNVRGNVGSGIRRWFGFGSQGRGVPDCV